MSGQESGKWAIREPGRGSVRIEFYNPAGDVLLASATFDAPAIREFKAALDEIVEALEER